MTNKILLGILALLLSSGVVHAQDSCTSITLNGALIIPVRDHVEKFPVLLMNYRGEQELAYSYIDMTGRFYFPNVQEGTFDVVVRVEGFKEMRERVDIGAPLYPNPVTGLCNKHEIYWLTPEDTVVILDERLRAYPKEAILEYVQAMTAESEKRPKDVIAHLEATVRLASDWFDARCELGAAYEVENRRPDAEKQYRRALELKPDGLRALISLGRLLVQDADDRMQSPGTRDGAPPIFRQAREVLVNATTLDPKDANAAYMLGAVDFRLASYKSAEIELKRALELDATVFPARITLINVYIQQQQWQNALNDLDTLIIETPSSAVREQMLTIRTSLLRRVMPVQ